MKKTFWAALLALCLCAALLAGCGGAAEPSAEPTAEPAAEPTPEPETDPTAGLVEYVAENVGTFWLPEGFEMETAYTEQPFPTYTATFTKGDIRIGTSWIGKATYDDLGLPLPADVEEYSQRDGIQSHLPEGVDYAFDEFGNMSYSFVNDEGMYTYDVLLLNGDAAGSIFLSCPDGTEGVEDFPLWASLSVLASAPAE